MSGMPSVTLRTPTAADRDVLFRIAADLDTWEERNPGPPVPLTRERFDARLDRAVEGDPAEVGTTFVVDVDGAAVGSTSMFDVDEFARLVEFGFVRRNLRRIHLQAIASNTGAIRAYEKAGFVVEGRLREHAHVRGAYEDVVLMAILRADRRSGAPARPAGP